MVNTRREFVILEKFLLGLSNSTVEGKGDAFTDDRLQFCTILYALCTRNTLDNIDVG